MIHVFVQLSTICITQLGVLQCICGLDVEMFGVESCGLVVVLCVYNKRDVMEQKV